jgi:hypothetical protein
MSIVILIIISIVIIIFIITIIIIIVIAIIITVIIITINILLPVIFAIDYYELLLLWLLGLSTFQLESPIDIVLFIIIIIIFFPPKKKKIYTVLRIVKHYGSVYSTSRKMLIMSPTHLTFDPLRSYLKFREKTLVRISSRKPLNEGIWNFH